MSGEPRTLHLELFSYGPVLHPPHPSWRIETVTRVEPPEHRACRQRTDDERAALAHRSTLRDLLADPTDED